MVSKVLMVLMSPLKNADGGLMVLMETVIVLMAALFFLWAGRRC
jgi:hypothetical protein